MTVARLTAEERKGFARYAREIDAEERRQGGYTWTPREPAMGTVDQQLGIIIRRLRRP